MILVIITTSYQHNDLANAEIKTNNKEINEQ
jgi:hypothetical protein